MLGPPRGGETRSRIADVSPGASRRSSRGVETFDQLLGVRKASAAAPHTTAAFSTYSSFRKAAAPPAKAGRKAPGSFNTAKRDINLQRMIGVADTAVGQPAYGHSEQVYSSFKKVAPLRAKDNKGRIRSTFGSSERSQAEAGYHANWSGVAVSAQAQGRSAIAPGDYKAPSDFDVASKTHNAFAKKQAAYKQDPRNVSFAASMASLPGSSARLRSFSTSPRGSARRGSAAPPPQPTLSPDELGTGDYVVMCDEGVNLRETADLSSPHVTVLCSDTQIRVTEVVRPDGTKRVRGRIDQPQCGWVTLYDLETGDSLVRRAHAAAPRRSQSAAPPPRLPSFLVEPSFLGSRRESAPPPASARGSSSVGSRRASSSVPRPPFADSAPSLLDGSVTDRSSVRSVAEWHCDQRGDGTLKAYTKRDSAEIEGLWRQHAGSGCVWTHLSFSSFAYVLDFDAMTQKNTNTGKVRRIERRVRRASDGVRRASDGTTPRRASDGTTPRRRAGALTEY